MEPTLHVKGITIYRKQTQKQISYDFHIQILNSKKMFSRHFNELSKTYGIRERVQIDLLYTCFHIMLYFNFYNSNSNYTA